MAVFHVFLLVLVIGIVHHSNGRTYESESITINGSTDTLAVKAPRNSPPKYDYFSLIFQWPMSFCNTGHDNCAIWIPNYFIVHGLWPQLDRGDITPCNSANNLNYTELDPGVYDYMYHNWLNLKARPNNINYRDWLRMRWSYEYQKHGSCFWPFKIYFLKAFEMAMQIGSVTDMILNKGGIQPNNSTPYHLSAFESAISRQLNIIPRLRCNRDRDGTFQLFEIEFCFNKSLSPIKCRRISNCRNSQVQPNLSVMFPRP